MRSSARDGMAFGFDTNFPDKSTRYSFVQLDRRGMNPALNVTGSRLGLGL